MTHFVCIVIGGDVERQLAPYDEQIEVEPYKRYESERSVEHFVEYCRRTDEEATADDFETLRPHMRDYYGAEGDMDDKGLYTMSTYNPDSKWDWYEIGGRWTGRLPLKDGSGCSVATAGEVDWDAFGGPPVACVAEGTWQAVGRVGWFGAVDRTNEDEWSKRFRAIVDALPGDTPITLVDCHI